MHRESKNRIEEKKTEKEWTSTVKRRHIINKKLKKKKWQETHKALKDHKKEERK